MTHKQAIAIAQVHIKDASNKALIAIRKGNRCKLQSNITANKKRFHATVLDLCEAEMKQRVMETS